MSQLQIMNTIFKALNDPTRRKMLELLLDRDMTAGEIAEQFSISFPSISHHLELLRHAALVSSEKDGQFIYYSLNSIGMEEATKWILQFRLKKK
jgi:DNA-binding transcriptional ArsR family regulator